MTLCSRHSILYTGNIDLCIAPVPGPLNMTSRVIQTSPQLSAKKRLLSRQRMDIDEALRIFSLPLGISPQNEKIGPIHGHLSYEADVGE
jgi:hypothetical protein